MAGNNLVGQSTRQTLGLGAPPSTVTTGSLTLMGIPLPTQYIDGTNNADTISATSLTNYIFGNGGNDILDLRGGPTIGIGGLGADTFIVGTAGTGIGTLAGGQIIDFSTAEGDKLDFSSVASNFSQLSIQTTSNNSSATITLNGNTYIVSGLDVRLSADNVITSGGAVPGSVAGGTQGTSGNDVLTGTAAADTILANAGNDVVSAGAGNDTVSGGKGDDLLNGNADNDLVSGNLGNDTVFGGKGDDTLYGGKDDDLVNGNLGTDMVYGDAGNDTLYGGQGTDCLLGGAGNDVFYGDRDADTLTGGEGADNFVFNTGHGVDVITDFVSGTDSLTFSSALFADANAAVAASAVNGSGNVVITTSSGNTVELLGISSLSASDVHIM